jgi:hypothetical protein
MRSLLLACVSVVALAPVASAQTFNIDFNSLTEGAVVSNQFAGTTGATFSPGGFSGAGGPTGAWATNTGMGVTANDVGGFGAGSPAPTGMLLHRFNADWLAENGDAVFTIDFSSPITSFSATFAGIATPASTRIFAFDSSSTQIGLVSASGSNGVQRLSLNGLTNATKIIVTPGDFNDWVGVDDISFTLAAGAAAPEPGSLALLCLVALPGIALLRRKK